MQIGAISSRLLVLTRALLLSLVACLAGSSTNLQAQPTNDNIANAIVLSNSSGIFRGFNTGATLQTNEPIHFQWQNTNSVWFRFTAQETGWLTLHTSNSFGNSSFGFSETDTILAAYEGTNFPLNAQLAVNDDHPFPPASTNSLWSLISIPVTQSNSYSIALVGYASRAGVGRYQLNWEFSTVNPNPTEPGGFSFGLPAQSVMENSNLVNVVVFHPNGSTSAEPATVRFTTVDGTAFGEYHYEPVDLVLEFAPGQMFTNIPINILNNNTINGSLTFNVILQEPSPGSFLGPITNTVITILDDEAPPEKFRPGEFVFSSFSYVTSDGQSLRWNPDNRMDLLGPLITVNRTNGALGRVAVDYYTTNKFGSNFFFNGFSTFPFFFFNTGTLGTRVADEFFDYTPVRGTLIFDDYQMSTNFLVPVSGAFFSSNTHSFISLVLANPRYVDEELTNNPSLIPPTLGVTSNAFLQIWNTGALVPAQNGQVPAVSIAKHSYRIDEGGGEVLIRVINPYALSGTITIFTSLGSNPKYSVPIPAGTDYADDGTFEFTNPIYTDGQPNLVNPQDFVQNRETFTFQPDDGFLTFRVTILDDDLPEFNEAFGVWIGVRGDSLPFQHDYATVTIVDDDLPAGSLDREWNRDNVAGTDDKPFNQTPGANANVDELVVMRDGKTVIAGDFTGFNSVPRNRIARLLQNGGIDYDFNPGTGADGPISALAGYPAASAHADKVLIGGLFRSYGGTARNRIARVLPTGALDETFNPGNGANGAVRSIDIDSGGKVLIGGEFTQFYGESRERVARLNHDGSLDTNFVPPTVNGNVWAIAADESPLSGGSVLIAGDFTFVGGQLRPGVARLLPNGRLDPNFNPGGGADNSIYAVKVQTDGKVLLGGAFSFFNFQPRRSIVRLNQDGSVDLSYDPGTGFDSHVYAINVQGDGKALVGGIFTEYNGTRRMAMARLHTNAVLDTSFMDTAYNQFAGLPKTYAFEGNHSVSSISVQPDGNIMIAGSFTNVGGNLPGEIHFDSQTNNFSRQNKRYRGNVARLIGGYTYGPGSVEFRNEDYSVDENSPTAVITLRRVDGRLGTIGAVVGTRDRTAQDKVDYLLTNAVPTWPEQIDGGTPRSVGAVGLRYFRFPIIDDQAIEGNETVDLNFVSPVGRFFLGGYGAEFGGFGFFYGAEGFEYVPLGAALRNYQARLTITDNDSLPGTLIFSQPVFYVNENEVTARVDVIRINGSSGIVSVDYFTTVDGGENGISTNDYTHVGGRLTFNSGETNRTILIPIFNDTLVEDEERFVMILTNASGGAFLPGERESATNTHSTFVAIIDNDYEPGRMNFSQETYSVDEGAGQFVVEVTRTGGNKGAVTLDAIVSGAGVHFTNRLNWANLDRSSRFITVPIINNLADEPDRLITLTLTNSTLPEAIGVRGTATLTVIDDDAPGILVFSQPEYFVDENGVSAGLIVNRLSGSAGALSVTYYTTDEGLTEQDRRYVPVTNIITFAEGETSQRIEIPILDDPTNAIPRNGDQTVLVHLSDPTSGVLGEPSVTALTIVDNERDAIPAGTLDSAFNEDPITGADDPVFAIALQNEPLFQPDGTIQYTNKILIGGDFNTVNSVTRRSVARLTMQGQLDQTFTMGVGPNAPVRSMLVQPDGKVLLGGFFNNISGTNRNHFARLHIEGALDTFFDPGAGPDNPVYAMALRPDGRIFVAGSFTTYNGDPRVGIALVNTNGSLNYGFDPLSGGNGIIYAIAIQTNGQLIVGGDFTVFQNQPVNRLVRLHANGQLDTNFNIGAGFDAAIRAVTIQPDGKVVVGGSFTSVNGETREYLARLNPNGSLDSSFLDNTPGGNGPVYTIAQQADGKLVIGGDFTRFSGVTRNRLTRLNPDGTVDSSINFGEGANGFVAALAIQPDRKILLGGGFTEYDGQIRKRIARIHGGSLQGSGTLEITQGDIAIEETTLGAEIVVRRRGGTFGEVSVLLTSEDLSAASSGPTPDYSAVTTNIVFPVGETFKTVLVRVNDDRELETNELYRAYLTIPQGSLATMGDQPDTYVTIVSDDSLVEISDLNFSINEGADSGFATINLTRSFSTNSTITVRAETLLNTGPGSATTNDFTPVLTTVTFLPGETNKFFIVPIITDNNPEPNETLRVRIFSVTGPGIIGRSEATLSIVDDDFASGELTIESALYHTTESAGEVTITVNRENGINGIVSVSYSAVSGTAIAGTDFTPSSGVLSFADSETQKTFTIPIIDNSVPNQEKTFTVVLSNPTGGASLGSRTSATVAIEDEESFPVLLSFSSTNYVATESGGAVLVAVTRRGDVSEAATITLSTLNSGSAVEGSDYTAVNTNLIWAPGDGSDRVVLININDDNVGEPQKVIRLQLANPSPNVRLGDAQAIITINDDDRTITFSQPSFSAREDSKFAAVTVVRQGMATNTATVRLETTAGGTAVEGTHYTAVSQDLTFLAGQTNATVFIQVFDDNFSSAPRTVFLRLVDVTGATLAPHATAVLSLLDDETINPPGTLDPDFNSKFGVDGDVFTVLLTTNENMVIGGNFSVVNGLPTRGIARLNNRGNVDPEFSRDGGANNTVHAIAVDSTGDFLVGGEFTALNGGSFNRLGRLRPNGVPVFNFNNGSGPNGTVRDIAFTPVQTILRTAVGTSPTNLFTFLPYPIGTVTLNYQFTEDDPNGFNSLMIAQGSNLVYNSLASNRVEQLTNGIITLRIRGGDTNLFIYVNSNILSTNTPANTNAWNFSFSYTIGPGGGDNIVIVGDFTEVNGTPRNRMARLFADGSVDPLFDPGQGADDSIYSVGVTGDRSYVIGGRFSSFNGTPANRIAAVTSSGAIDPAFSGGFGANGLVRALELDVNDRITIAGDFTMVDRVPRQYLARLDRNGALDPSFDPGAGPNAPVRNIALQESGHTLAVGEFTTFNGEPVGRIARLNPNGSLDVNFDTGTGADRTINAVSLGTLRSIVEVPRAASGGPAEDRLVVNLPAPSGTLYLFYNFYNVPDRLVVYGSTNVNGTNMVSTNRLFNTGLINGGQLVEVKFTNETSLTIVVNEGGGEFGTIWDYFAVVLAQANLSDKILIGGAFNSFNDQPFGKVALLEPNGSPDQNFTPGFGGANAIHEITRYSETASPDVAGKYIVAGDFSTIVGVQEQYIARLNTDGTYDPSFNPEAGPNAPVRAVLARDDGSVIAGGLFTTVNNIPRRYLVRFLSSGTVDPGFNSGIGFNNSVLALAEQPDSRILVGGAFTAVANANRAFITRLNPNGTLDLTFNAQFDGAVRSIAYLPDGKILVGGEFTSVDGISRNRIARLHPDGSLDRTFDPGTGADNVINTIAVQPDGRILLGGGFTSFNGVAAGRIVRLNPDGTVDNTFTGSGANGLVQSISIQEDGKIIVAGSFNTFNGLPRNFLTRLAADGSIDPTIDFGAGPNSFVNATLSQPDQRLLIGGAFTRFDNIPRNALARLYTGSAVGPGLFTLSQTNFIASENDGSAVVIIRRTHGAEGEASVVLTTADLSGRAGIDYSAVSTNVVFRAGETVRSVQVPLFNRTGTNGSRTVSLTLSNPAGGAGLGENPTSTLTIEDSESILGFALGSYFVNEDAGAARIQIIRTGSTNEAATVSFSTSGGTASGGVHYTPVFTQVAFPAGVRSQFVTVPIIDNLEAGASRTVGLFLANQSGSALLGRSEATLTIFEDELSAGVIGFASNTFRGFEDEGFANITITRTNGSAGTVSVTFRTRATGSALPGSDFFENTENVIFEEGETSKVVQVTLVNNSESEGPETVNLALIDPQGAVLGLANAQLVIDDDDGPGTFAFMEQALTVLEANTNLTITIRRQGGSQGEASIQVHSAGGSATAESDYSFTSRTITFTNGQRAATISIPIMADNTVEVNETFELVLANPTGGTLVGSPSSILVSIVDRDVSFGFNSATYFASEIGLSTEVIVVRHGNTNSESSVIVVTGNGTATAGQDYLSTSNVLVFAAGETNKLIRLAVLDDSIVEGEENFSITLIGPSAGATLGPIVTAAVRIQDNDTGISFSAASVSQVEGNIAQFGPQSFTPVAVTVYRSGDLSQQSSVDFSTVNGTATASAMTTNSFFFNGDYIGTNGTLFFDFNQASNTFFVTVIGDNAVEGNETIGLVLSNPTNAALFGQQESTLNIIDDDVGISFATANFRVSERATNAVITITRTGVSSSSISVDFTTADGSAVNNEDYTRVPTTVTWGPEDVSPRTVLIPVIPDGNPEGAETVNLFLSNPQGGAVLGVSSALLTIVDNAGLIYFSSPVYNVAENGNNAIVTLYRTGGSNGLVTVDVSTTNGSATAGTDFTSINFPVQLGHGETNRTVLIPILNDSNREGAENFIVRLSNPRDGAEIGTPSSAQVRISDDEVGTIISAGASFTGSATLQHGVPITVRLALRNTGSADTGDLIAQLAPGGGVSAESPSFQSYGTLVAGGGAVTREFTFTPVATNGGVIVATLRLTDGGINLGEVTYTFSLGNQTVTFQNANVITIDDNRAANPYPSTIDVSRMGTQVDKVTVTLRQFSHTFPRDVDVLLVSPNGRTVMLMSDSGPDGPVQNLTLTFDDAAANGLPLGSLSSGTFRPANHEASSDPLPAPAPAAPFGTTLNEFRGIDPNGTWSLYVVDDLMGDVGTFAGGWSLSITTSGTIDPVADLTTAVRASAASAGLNQNITYTVTVTNNGPADAVGVRLTNNLPAGSTFVSASSSVGTISTVNGALIANIGSLAYRSNAVVNITVQASTPGNLVLSSTVGSTTADSVAGNNSASASVNVAVVTSASLSAQRQNGNLVISWTAPQGSFVLQGSSTLAPNSWGNVNAVVTHQDGVNTATIPLSANHQFFRLQRAQ